MPPKMPSDGPSSEPYEVGYGKPPEKTRFQKGRSGNPKGRPKNSLNLATELQDILSETVNIRENGREIKISKLRLMLLANVNKAIKSDGRALNTIVALMQRTNIGLPPLEESVDDTSTEDEATLDRYLADLRANVDAGEPGHD